MPPLLVRRGLQKEGGARDRRRPVLVLLSDMLQDSDGFRLEKTALIKG